MLSLTYISIRTDILDEDALNDIISLANRCNEQHKITGQLISCPYFVVQTIEGEQPAIEQLFDNIKRDTRHFNVDIVERKEISVREYSNWMAKKTISITEFASKLRELGWSQPLGKH